MNDISALRAMAAPLILLMVMLGSAIGGAILTRVDGTYVFVPYILAWASITFLSVMAWVFIEVARLAPAHADRPLQEVFGRLIAEQRLLAIPALIFPAFLGAYTWAKTSIPFAVGFPWEEFWADADRAFLGSDAWRLAHATFPDSFGSAWAFFYAVVWGFALGLSGPLISVFASRRFTARFFTAMMLSWFVGGFILAYRLSAAGPVFAHLADPALAGRFAPLRAELLIELGSDNIVLETQRYLGAAIQKKVALKGGGVSAMPSMHIATATILVLAARRTRWLAPAALFLLLTFVGSVYLGYHYAVDAPVAAVVAILCWVAAGRIYRAPLGTRVPPHAFTRR